MELIIILIIISLIAALVIMSRRKATSNCKDVLNVEQPEPAIYAISEANDIKKNEITVHIELLPATTKFNEKSLFEITDSTIISRISDLIPFTSQTGTMVIAQNALNSLKDTELVKMDIPFSKLTKSKEVASAARGYAHSGKGLAAQANLTKVDTAKITKTTELANGVANVMNVGSLVVGQYYMTEISSKLETLTNSMNKIGDFKTENLRAAYYR